MRVPDGCSPRVHIPEPTPPLLRPTEHAHLAAIRCFEGTLGVITGCAIACPRAPTSTQLAFLGLESYDAVLATFGAAKRDLGEVLSAVEFLDAASYELVTSGARKTCRRAEHAARKRTP